MCAENEQRLEICHNRLMKSRLMQYSEILSFIKFIVRQLRKKNAKKK